MTHPNRTYNREQLINFVWGLTSYIDERTVDVQVRRLRDELKPHQQHHLIKTIRGVGYQFSSEDFND
jgi:two-component system phosphate regulon response regulator PhoB